MTKKRFEYYMTDKRFVIKPSAIVTDGFVIIDKEKKYTFPVLDSTLNYMFNKALNELYEENQELKRTIKKMGELGGFNKHMIKTICGDVE